MSEKLGSYSRRDFLTLASGAIGILGLLTGKPERLALCASSAPLIPRKNAHPLIGATYWGGWFKDSEWSNYLQDPNWSGRLPFFARNNPVNNRIEINGDRQDVVNQEILYASQAGLDYLNFCYYNPYSASNKYNYGLDLFLKSDVNTNLSYALILQGSHVGAKENWSGFVDNLVRHFNHPRYQKLKDKRPLISVFDIPNFHKTFDSDYSKVKQSFAELRVKTIKSGLNNPFIVAKNADGELKELGFDAFGAYTANGPGLHREYPYSALMEANHNYWEADRREGKLVVPLVNFGWDPRPRINHPVYGKDYKLGPWYLQPTEEQIQIHLKMAFRWLTEHYSCSTYQLVDTYAWNELDECGPGLIPTLREGASKLNAFKKCIEEFRS